ncbi:response regulator [Flavobacterium aquicola]|nr:response regulator [Flavobacterium aquicola]
MKTIFLIDDDSDDREIFEETLLSLNIDVKYEDAKNGAEAWEKLTSGTIDKPDLIFLDLNMPVMDGRQFLKHYKQDQSFNDIPVIIYTTSSNEADKNFAVQNNTLFMTKQYSMSALRADLQEVIKKFLKL